jgi:hypothetical protein
VVHSRHLWLPALFLLSYACGGSPVGPKGHEVGASCTKDLDCAKQCTLSVDFGSGICTRPCTADTDCPQGATCVAVQGGVCAVSCRTDNDCKVFGQTFFCESKSRPTGGEVSVCRPP